MFKAPLRIECLFTNNTTRLKKLTGEEVKNEDYSKYVISFYTINAIAPDIEQDEHNDELPVTIVGSKIISGGEVFITTILPTELEIIIHNHVKNHQP